MNKINRIVSTIVTICFVFNTAISDLAFARSFDYSPRIDKLAAESRFDPISEPELGHIAKIKAALLAELLASAGNGATADLEEYVSRINRYKNTDFPAATLEFCVPGVTLLTSEIDNTLPNGYVCVKCRVTDSGFAKRQPVYYAVFSQHRDGDNGFPIYVYKEGEYERFKASGVLKTLPKREAAHEAAIDRNVEHEVSLDPQSKALDEFIRGKMKNGEYAIGDRFYNISDSSNPYKGIYRNAKRVFDQWQQEELLRRVLKKLGDAGVNPESIARLRRILTEKPLVIIYRNKNEQLPQLTMPRKDGSLTKIEVRAHSSDNAIYIIQDAESFAAVSGRELDGIQYIDLNWQDQSSKARFEESYLYEATAHFRLLGWVEPGLKLNNVLTDAVASISENRKLDQRTQEFIERLEPVKLLSQTLLTRDHAASESSLPGNTKNITLALGQKVEELRRVPGWKVPQRGETIKSIADTMMDADMITPLSRLPEDYAIASGDIIFVKNDGVKRFFICLDSAKSDFVAVGSDGTIESMILHPSTAGDLRRYFAASDCARITPNDAIAAKFKLYIREITELLAGSAALPAQATAVTKPGSTDMAAQGQMPRDLIANLKLLSNIVRRDILEMLFKAKSGHPGGSLSVAEILTTLYFGGVLNYDPKDPNWENRDRVVLSAGHKAPALYAVLAEAGFFSKEEFKHLRESPEAMLQGHVDMRQTPGVDLSTGALGQGFSTAVGMAAAARLQGKNIHIWSILGGGEEQEGQVSEAARHAAALGLTNQTVIIDNNGYQIEGEGSKVDSADIQKMWKGYGWDVLEIDGHDPMDLLAAMKFAKDNLYSGKPVCIIATTKKGKGVPVFEEQPTKSHGEVPKDGEKYGKVEKVEYAKVFAELDTAIGIYSQDKLNRFRQSAHVSADLKSRIDRWNTESARKLAAATPAPLKKLEPGAKEATRASFGDALVYFGSLDPRIVAMSADLAPSNKMEAFEKAFGRMSPENPTGRYIALGIREAHGASFAQGLALMGLVPFIGTFDIFSLNMAPQVRVAAQNQIPVIFAPSHSGIAVGEDAKSHQGVESPGVMDILSGPLGDKLDIYEPADRDDTIVVFKAAVAAKKPVYLRLTRQDVQLLDKSGVADYEQKVLEGSYIIRDPGNGKNDIIIVATGATVANAVEASKALEKEGYKVKVINVISINRIDDKDNPFRTYLEDGVPIVTVCDAYDKVLKNPVLRATNEARKNGNNPGAVYGRGVTILGSASWQKMYERNGLDVKGITEFVKTSLPKISTKPVSTDMAGKESAEDATGANTAKTYGPRKLTREQILALPSVIALRDKYRAIDPKTQLECLTGHTADTLVIHSAANFPFIEIMPYYNKVLSETAMFVEYRQDEQTAKPAGTDMASPAELQAARNAYRYLSISMGGDKLAVSVIDGNNNIIGKPVELRWADDPRYNNGQIKAKTPEKAGEVMDTIIAMAAKLITDGIVNPSEIKMVNAGLAGPLDKETGVFGSDFPTPNLPFAKYPFRSELQSRLARLSIEVSKIVMVNDGEAARNGEHYSPKGKLAGKLGGIVIIGGGINISVDGDDSIKECGHNLYQVEADNGETPYAWGGIGSKGGHPIELGNTPDEIKKKSGAIGEEYVRLGDAAFRQAYPTYPFINWKTGLRDFEDMLSGPNIRERVRKSVEANPDKPEYRELKAIAFDETLVGKDKTGQYERALTIAALRGNSVARGWIAKIGNEVGHALAAFAGAYWNRPFIYNLVLVSGVNENLGKGVDEVSGVDLYMRSLRTSMLKNMVERRDIERSVAERIANGVVRSDLTYERELMSYQPTDPEVLTAYRGDSAKPTGTDMASVTAVNIDINGRKLNTPVVKQSLRETLKSLALNPEALLAKTSGETVVLVNGAAPASDLLNPEDSVVINYKSPLFFLRRPDNRAGQHFYRDNYPLTLMQIVALSTVSGMMGITTNLSIFQKYAESGQFDEAIRLLVKQGIVDESVIYDMVTMPGFQEYARLIGMLTTEGGQVLGTASYEVPPQFIHTPSQTADYQLLIAELDSSVMVKTPSTAAGFAAVRDNAKSDPIIRHNMTLMFGFEQWVESQRAQIDMLEARVRAGLPINDYFGVDSFFLSRTDILLNALFDILAKSGKLKEEDRAAFEKIRDKVAVAQAKIVGRWNNYVYFGKLPPKGTPCPIGVVRLAQRFEEVKRAARQKGLGEIRPRVPLWASTQVKEADLKRGVDSLLYFVNLIGTNTVDTMPDGLIAAIEERFKGLTDEEKEAAIRKLDNAIDDNRIITKYNPKGESEYAEEMTPDHIIDLANELLEKYSGDILDIKGTHPSNKNITIREEIAQYNNRLEELVAQGTMSQALFDKEKIRLSPIFRMDLESFAKLLTWRGGDQFEEAYRKSLSAFKAKIDAAIAEGAKPSATDMAAKEQASALETNGEDENLISHISVSYTEEEMGMRAAAAIMRDIEKTIAEKGRAVILFASAPSQHSTWKHLLKIWDGFSPEHKNYISNRIIAFHMDEYVGLPENAEQLFGKVLRERLFTKLGIRPENIHYFNDRLGYETACKLRKAVKTGNAKRVESLTMQLESEIQPHIEALAREFESYGGKFDIVIGGIGKLPHLAFNDPPKAKFNDAKVIKLVQLTETSRQQQVEDKEFKKISDVPTHALTFSLTPILSAGHIHIMVPHSFKAEAVRQTLDLGIDESIPASGLRLPNVLPNVRIYLDKNSAALSRVAQLAAKAQTKPAATDMAGKRKPEGQKIADAPIPVVRGISSLEPQPVQIKLATEPSREAMAETTIKPPIAFAVAAPAALDIRQEIGPETTSATRLSGAVAASDRIASSIVTPEMTRDVAALRENAPVVGGQIWSKGGKYNLIIPDEFASIDDLHSTRGGFNYNDRFDFERVGGGISGSMDKYIDVVLERVRSGEADRTVVLVPQTHDLTEAHLERLQSAGLRFIIMPLEDVNVRNNPELRDEEIRLRFQRHTFAEMALFRFADETTLQDPIIYSAVAMHLGTHFNLDNVTAAEYLNALKRGDVAVLIKGYLSYRKFVRYDAIEEHRSISYSLIFA